MSKKSLVAALGLACMTFVFSPLSQASAEIRFGVMANRGELAAQNQWAAFVEYLAEKTGQPVKLVVFPIEKTFEVVEANGVDFVYTNPVQSAGLVRKHGGRTIVNRNSSSGNVFAGVVIASKKSGVAKSADVKGKKVMAYNTTSAGAYVFQRYHLLENGIDITKDVASLKFAKKQDDIVLATRAGLVDVGFVRSGVLESMEKAGKIEKGDVTVVDAVTNDGFGLAHSTALYPSWYIVALGNTAPDVADAVAKASLTLPKDHPAAQKAKITGFTDPVSIDGLIAVLEELQLAPFDK